MALGKFVSTLEPVARFGKGGESLLGSTAKKAREGPSAVVQVQNKRLSPIQSVSGRSSDQS